MECKTCGAQITGESSVCPNCENAAKTVTQKKKFCGLCVAGFVLGIVSLLLTPTLWTLFGAGLAIVFGFVGIKNAKTMGERGIALAKWGIGLGIFSLCALAAALVYTMLDFAAR